MKLHDALQKLCRESGYIALQKKTLLDQLGGLDAFGEIPETRDVMKEFVSLKCGKELCGRGRDRPSYPSSAERISKALAEKGRLSRELACYAADSACFALGLTDSVTVPAAPEPSSGESGEDTDEDLPSADRMPETEEEAENCRKLAERGDVQAQLLMGSLCLLGRFTDYDPEAGAGWYRMAARKEFAPAMSSLAGLYASGFGVRQDYGEAFKYSRAAGEGNDLAQMNLGLMYEEGKAAGQDYAEALKWYRKSADQGYDLAMCKIGHFYEQGLGVRQDYAEPLKWNKKSAEKGCMLAQTAIGLRYMEGRGVRQDLKEARKWLERVSGKDA